MSIINFFLIAHERLFMNDSEPSPFIVDTPKNGRRAIRSESSTDNSGEVLETDGNISHPFSSSESQLSDFTEITSVREFAVDFHRTRSDRK